MISNILVLSLFVASVFGGSTIINDGLYILETRVSLSGDSIRVKITAEGNGYIGFGISPSGTMTGADIVIAGYDESVAKGYLDVSTRRANKGMKQYCLSLLFIKGLPRRG